MKDTGGKIFDTIFIHVQSCNGQHRWQKCQSLMQCKLWTPVLMGCALWQSQGFVEPLNNSNSFWVKWGCGNFVFFSSSDVWRCHPKEMSLASPRSSLNDRSLYYNWEFLSTRKKLCVTSMILSNYIQSSVLLKDRKLEIFAFATYMKETYNNFCVAV